MNNTSPNPAIIAGWPVAPVIMVLIALGWQAATIASTWRASHLLGTGRRGRSRCMSEWQRLREEFGRYVGEEVAHRALSHGTETGGRERDVAVLFVDLVGSTTLVATRRPSEVATLLNEFFQVVVAVTHRHGGFVNKFQGDAALAVFGAPVEHRDAAGAALAAARELHDQLAWALRGDRFGIGVSAGLAFAGEVGAPERFEYTVIGDPVNEAARLTELAKTDSGHVLASATALRGAQEAEASSWDLGELVELRGRHVPTRVARPAAHTTPTPVGTRTGVQNPSPNYVMSRV